VQFGLAHRALEAEQQPVVELAGRVDAVAVADQRPRQRAQIQELVPVRGRAREPRDLQGQDHADVSEADLGDEFAEADPRARPRRRVAGVLVDDDD